MKDICQNIFCFWRKWCNKSSNSFVSIESSTMENTQKEADRYSNVIAPKHIDKNDYNFQETEMSTALPIEEEMVFPLKYLNNYEADSSFHFEFTKEKILSFIEKEINDNVTYTSLINKNGFDIYI